MVVLSIETSSLTGGAAIIASGRVLGEFTLSSKRTYSRRLLSSVLYLLNELGLAWQDLDLIAVGLGPGSFTGLRIGISTAKGLALAHSLPIFGIPTLDVIAQNAQIEDRRLICPVMDARRQQVYTCLYRPGFPRDPQRITDYKAIEPDKLGELIPSNDDILFIGDGINNYGELFIQNFKKRASFAPEHLWHPRPSITGLIAEKRKKLGIEPETPQDLAPLYCRLSEAEEKRKQDG